MQKKSKRLEIKPETKVFVDPKTNARTIALPFRLPDNTAAALMICRLKDEQWEPKDIIKSITVEYHED